MNGAAACPRALSSTFCMLEESVRLGWLQMTAGLTELAAVVPTNDSLHEDLDDRLIFGRVAVAMVVLVLLLSAGATIGFPPATRMWAGTSSLRDARSPVVK